MSCDCRAYHGCAECSANSQSRQLGVAHWQWVPGQAVPTYIYRTLVAVYHRTVRGYAEYRVYPAAMSASKRKPAYELARGGLPSMSVADELATSLAPIERELLP